MHVVIEKDFAHDLMQVMTGHAEERLEYRTTSSACEQCLASFEEMHRIKK